MAMNYTPIPFDFLEEMEELSDAEYGRLVRWGQYYHLTGEKSKLSGNERFYSKRMQMQIDRYVESYNEKIDNCKKAGQASANARQQPSTDVNARQQPSTDVNGRQQTSTDVNKTKTKTKDKTNAPKGAITRPSLDEVREYAKSRNSTVNPDKFFEFFNEGNWVDSNGKQVKNWKQKFLTWESHDTGKKAVSGSAAMDLLPPADEAEDIAYMKRLFSEMEDGA